MKILYNRFIPTKGFDTFNLFGYIVARESAYPLSKDKQVHENIHTAQIREMGYLFFYIWYAIEWLVRLIQYKDRFAALFNISFEREAYANDRCEDYLSKRGKYSFLKYMRAKKYGE